ncbi:hypothetical protein L950_0214895 [Sphingobacterium sp. IITKGP-BTPF85]|nr:DUF6713 family protein [Sphingobacterium sp. IITKGP-BTPF85]KKX49559.1 hypothetical protein L950_0214895 [Sphingobacterium sp. IITKGP-BTPF85]
MAYFPRVSTAKGKLGICCIYAGSYPTFLFIVWGLTQPSENFIIGFDIFTILHLALHLLYLRHQKNEFKDWISWTIITGIAVFGTLDLLF